MNFEGNEGSGLADKWEPLHVFSAGGPCLAVYKRLIASGPLEIGGETVYSSVPLAYCGLCAVVDGGVREKVVAVLPSYTEARRVALYAITPDGGFGSVEIKPTASEPTHCTFYDWLESPCLEAASDE